MQKRKLMEQGFRWAKFMGPIRQVMARGMECACAPLGQIRLEGQELNAEPQLNQPRLIYFREPRSTNIANPPTNSKTVEGSGTGVWTMSSTAIHE
jgi:hypothetical protein